MSLSDEAKSNLDVYIRECQEILDLASDPHGISKWSLRNLDPAEVERLLHDRLVQAAKRLGRAHREMVLWLQSQTNPKPAIKDSQYRRNRRSRE